MYAAISAASRPLKHLISLQVFTNLFIQVMVLQGVEPTNDFEGTSWFAGSWPYSSESYPYEAKSEYICSTNDVVGTINSPRFAFVDCRYLMIQYNIKDLPDAVGDSKRILLLRMA